SPADSGDRFEGREGQSWAEKILKNGRILVGFQKLRKPQDAKGPYFPRNSPSTLPEWGSGALSAGGEGYPQVWRCQTICQRIPGNRRKTAYDVGNLDRVGTVLNRPKCLLY